MGVYVRRGGGPKGGVRHQASPSWRKGLRAIRAVLQASGSKQRQSASWFYCSPLRRCLVGLDVLRFPSSATNSLQFSWLKIYSGIKWKDSSSVCLPFPPVGFLTCTSCSYIHTPKPQVLF